MRPDLAVDDGSTDGSEVATPTPAARRRWPPGSSPTWVLLGTVVNAVTTWALLAVVVRAVSTTAAADFSVFWSVVVIAGLGFFLPVEQETTRRVARVLLGRGVGGTWRLSARFAGIVAVVLVVPAVTFWALTGHPATAAAFALAVAGYAIQFSARGVLAGRRRLARYGAIPAIDAVLRLVGAITLVVAGARTSPPYEIAVAGSAVAAGVAAVLLSRHDRRPDADPAAHPAGRFGRDAGRLIVAAACMQALLNSGTLLAKAFARPDQVALVATLLVTMTVARLPVFVFQSLQATYLTHLASGMHRGEIAAVRRLLALLASAVLVIGALLIVGAALVGPWAVSTFFGARYQVTEPAAVLVATSVAAYMAASVANDVSVAVGAHQRIVLAWPIGLILGGVTALLIPDLTVRSILPLAVGALVALVVLLPGIVKRVKRVRTVSR